MNANGNAMIAWYEPSLKNVMYRKFVDGKLSNEPTRVNQPDNAQKGRSYQPAIACVPNSKYTIITYSDDADNNGYLYLKRFLMENSKKPVSYIGDNAENKEMLLTDTVYPRLLVTFGGADADRMPLEIDAETFIAVKGYKAKGKRIATWQVEKVEELEPLRHPEPEAGTDAEGDGASGAEADDNLDPDAGKSQQQVIDEITGQLNLFSDIDNGNGEAK